MPTWVWILFVLVVVLAAVRVLTRRALLHGVDPTQVSLSPEVANQARALALQGQKVHAIKLIRDHTQMPLAAAKMIVDRMVAGGPRGGDPTWTDPSPEVADQARALVLQGQKIAAIKLIRDDTQLPLAAAKMIVDRMAADDQQG